MTRKPRKRPFPDNHKQARLRIKRPHSAQPARNHHNQNRARNNMLMQSTAIIIKRAPICRLPIAPPQQITPRKPSVQISITKSEPPNRKAGIEKRARNSKGAEGVYGKRYGKGQYSKKIPAFEESTEKVRISRNRHPRLPACHGSQHSRGQSGKYPAHSKGPERSAPQSDG